MTTKHPSSTIKLSLLSMVIAVTLGLSACGSDADSKTDRKTGDAEQKMSVANTKQPTVDSNESQSMLEQAKAKANETMAASSDMLATSKDKMEQYKDTATDKIAEGKAKADEYKDVASDKLAGGKDMLINLKDKATAKKSEAESLLDKAKKKITEGDGGA